jgi:hypothetical protein
MLTRDIRKIVDAGLDTLAETMDMLRAVPVDDRLDQVYLKGLTACTRAAVEIAKDQREADECIRRQAQVQSELLALAEHFRKVEADRVDTALAILGTRVNAMEPEKLAAFFRQCSSNPMGFIEAAKAFIGAPALPPAEEPST